MKGLFAGLNTIDIHFITDGYPRVNTKTLVNRNAVYIGGPATNAAIAFSNLGGEASLITSVGNHLFREFVLNELKNNGVNLFDLSKNCNIKPVISTVITSGKKGDRTVLTVNPGSNTDNTKDGDNMPESFYKEELKSYDIILLDCFHINYATKIAKEARKLGIPVVIDGGSWKQGMEDLLEFVDIAICSADFYPPGAKTIEEVFEYLALKNCKRIAVTRGEDPVIYRDQNQQGRIVVNKINAIDTLGAGDIFHGAFCFYFLKANNFAEALKKASVIASESCKYQGTRGWIQELK